MWRRAILILFFLFANADLVRAVQPDEVLNDAALETRAPNLSRELRCMVCKISRPMIQSAVSSRLAAARSRAPHQRRQRSAGA